MDKNKLAIIIVLAILILIFGSKILNEILEALDMKDTKEEKQEKELYNNTENSDIWKPTFYQSSDTPKGSALLTVAVADAKAKKIDKAIGTFTDSPNEIEAVFNSLKTQTQLSFLAYRFNIIFKKDMYSFLKDKLDTEKQRETLTRIIKRMNSLPPYFA